MCVPLHKEDSGTELHSIGLLQDEEMNITENTIMFNMLINFQERLCRVKTPKSTQLWGLPHFMHNSHTIKAAVCVCVCVCNVFTLTPADLPCVVKLQSQVIPVFVIRWHHRLQCAGIVAPPVVTQVDNSILAAAQLSPKFRLACHKPTHLLYLGDKMGYA